MLQRISTVLLDIETFILDLTTQPSSFIGQSGYRLSGDGEIGNPFEAGGLRCGFGILFGFQAFECGDRVFAPLGIDIGDVVHPAQTLGRPQTARPVAGRGANAGTAV